MTNIALAPPSYPTPPVEISADHGLSVIFLVLCSICMAVMVAFAVTRARRGDYLLLACAVGGLLAGVLEPLLDYQGLLWFAKDNAVIAVQTVERYIPLYVVLGYAFYFGAGAYIAFKALMAGRPRTFYLRMWVIFWILDFTIQQIGVRLDLYRYYGHQPFELFDIPLWWVTLDCAEPFIGALIFFGLRRQMRGWGSLLAVPLIPAAYAAVNEAEGWPVFTALNSNFDAGRNANGSDLQLWLGGGATIALAVLFTYLAIEVVSGIAAEQGAEAPRSLERQPERF